MTKEANNELKPCPNPGCRSQLRKDAHWAYRYVACDICNLRGPFADSESAAVAAWNALPRATVNPPEQNYTDQDNPLYPDGHYTLKRWKEIQDGVKDMTLQDLINYLCDAEHDGMPTEYFEREIQRRFDRLNPSEIPDSSVVDLTAVRKRALIEGEIVGLEHALDVQVVGRWNTGTFESKWLTERTLARIEKLKAEIAAEPVVKQPLTTGITREQLADLIKKYEDAFIIFHGGWLGRKDLSDAYNAILDAVFGKEQTNGSHE